MNEVLTLVLALAVIALGHLTQSLFVVLCDRAIAARETGRAMNLEDTGHAAKCAGYFVAGMLVMAVLLSPYFGGIGR